VSCTLSRKALMRRSQYDGHAGALSLTVEAASQWPPWATYRFDTPIALADSMRGPLSVHSLSLKQIACEY